MSIESSKLPVTPASGAFQAVTSQRVSDQHRCWRCLWRLAQLGLIIFTLGLGFVSVMNWLDNRAVRQELVDFKFSPRLVSHIAALHIDVDRNMRQPYIVTWPLSVLPNAANCGSPKESTIKAMACPALKLLPFPTTVANALTNQQGQRSIRINLWSDWGYFVKKLAGENVPNNQIFAWTIWHEVGHFYEADHLKAYSPWYDPERTHHAALYRETHADIFAIISIGQEPGVTRSELNQISNGVLKLRKLRAEDDPMHATDELLSCLVLDDFITKEDVVVASQRVFESALQRYAAGKCFTAPKAVPAVPKSKIEPASH